MSIATVTVSPISAADAPPPPRDGKMVEHFITRLQKELDLTPAQTAQFRAALKPDSLVPPPDGFVESPRNGHRGPPPGMMPPFGEEFLAQLRADKVDTATLNREFAGRQAEMKFRHDRHVAVFVQLHAVLTPAQRAKLADLLEKRRDKMRDRADHDRKPE